MKKFRMFALFVALILLVTLPLSACAGKGEEGAAVHTVTFSAGVVGEDTVTGMPAPIEAEDGQKVSRPAEEPEREGFTFKDWYTAPSGGELFDFDGTPVTEDMTVYAQWQYVVSGSGDGGSEEEGPAEGEEDFVVDPLVRVACVGDSLTYGNASPSTAYPVVLRELLGEGYTVGNFGRNGASVTGAPDGNPAYSTLTQYEASLDFNPDIVLIMLGTNDAQDWSNAAASYKADLELLIMSYRKANADVSVILMTSPVVLGVNQYDIVEEDIEQYIAPIQRTVAEEQELALVDVRAEMQAHDGYETFFLSDKVHLTPEGGQFIAGLAAEAVEEASESTQSKPAPTDLYKVSYSKGEAGTDAVAFMPAAVTVEKGGTAAEPQDKPKREGYDFTGWYTAPSGGELFDFSQKITESITLYAQWTPAVTVLAEEADLVLFIGQSNMAGRGTAAEATQVADGHAYEFRAISDPTCLYPLTEPFGANENNAESGVSESKKTGSMVSAFCESYFAETGTPIVAVSCSKGGEPISFFDTDGAPYRDAVARMTAAKEYLTSSDSEIGLRNVYVVWLQGESDGDRSTSAEEYTAALDRIATGFAQDIGSEQFFVIPIGMYNGSNESRNAAYTVIRQAQIEYCRENADATVISTQLADMYAEGLMKDEFHYYQAGYEIVGRDAGENMGYFVNTGKKPVCVSASEKAPALQEGGAWLEQDGQVVISAAAAFENSAYASYANGESADPAWVPVSGYLTGARNAYDNGVQYTLEEAVEKAPYLQFKINIATPGTYYVYIMMTSPSGGSNSAFVGIDGNVIDCGAPTTSGTARWQYNSNWSFELSEGQHTLTLYVREDGIAPNQIVLRNEYDGSDLVQGNMLTESAREKIG